MASVIIYSKTRTDTLLTGKLNTAQVGQPNGVAGLNSNGDVVDSTGTPVTGGTGGGLPGVTVTGTPVADQVLTATSASAATWKTPAVASLPAGSTLTVLKAAGAWPARPTSRTDIVVQWKGPTPAPAIITTGTGGALNNVDVLMITES